MSRSSHPDMATGTNKWLWYGREKAKKTKQTRWERWDLNVTEDPCIQLWTWKPEASISGLRFRVCLRCHHRLSTDGFIYLTWQATSKAGCRVKVRERQDRSIKEAESQLLEFIALQYSAEDKGPTLRSTSTWCFRGQNKMKLGIKERSIVLCHFINCTGRMPNTYSIIVFYLDCLPSGKLL